MFFFLSFTVHYQFFGLDEDCCCHGKACGPFLLCMGTKRADHLTFQGGGMSDLVWVKKFSPNLWS